MGKTEVKIISVVCVNSRGDKHPLWLQTAVDSVKKQTVECELILIDNIGRKKTIGQCFNEGARQAKYDLVLFLGDDDWISQEYCSVLLQYALAYPNFVMYSTNMTAFDEKEKIYSVLQRICTGMWRKDYLLKYPFNETLRRGIDREYIQEMQKRGDVGMTINSNYGYYYRKHDDYSSSGKIVFKEDNKTDIYVLTSSTNFIDPLVARWQKNNEVFVSTAPFNPLIADNAKVIWCEWLRQDAIDASKYECKAKKILRLHSYEAFSPLIYYVNFKKFDKVIFIAEHIKDFVESKVGKIENAVVIPVGIDVSKFNLNGKVRNNKIAYAGEISRKKGIGELLLLANTFSEYEFHIAGKFTEEDVARVFNENKPDNVFIEPYSYDLNKFFEDKTYVLNCSLREGNPITVLEGMACGCHPIINNWIGAVDLFDEESVYSNIYEFGKILEKGYFPKEYRQFVEDNFNIEKTFKQIDEIIEPYKP